MTEREELVAELRSMLDRPNDWPLGEDLVGYWLSVKTIRAIVSLIAAMPTDPPKDL